LKEDEGKGRGRVESVWMNSWCLRSEFGKGEGWKKGVRGASCWGGVAHAEGGEL
jgi:hypothetical protein